MWWLLLARILLLIPWICLADVAYAASQRIGWAKGKAWSKRFGDRLRRNTATGNRGRTEGETVK